MIFLMNIDKYALHWGGCVGTEIMKYICDFRREGCVMNNLTFKACSSGPLICDIENNVL